MQIQFIQTRCPYPIRLLIIQIPILPLSHDFTIFLSLSLHTFRLRDTNISPQLTPVIHLTSRSFILQRRQRQRVILSHSVSNRSQTYFYIHHSYLVTPLEYKLEVIGESFSSWFTGSRFISLQYCPSAHVTFMINFHSAMTLLTPCLSQCCRSFVRQLPALILHTTYVTRFKPETMRYSLEDAKR